MNQKHILSAVLGLAIGTLFATAADAAICLAKSSSGACLLWSGSVNCENLNASGLGNVSKTDTAFICNVSGPVVNGAVQPLTGTVFCSNGGGTAPVGLNAYGPGTIDGAQTITPDMVDKNGFASGGFVHSSLTQDQLDSLTQSVCMNQNKNWYAIDFVPDSMSVTISAVTISCTTDSNGVETCTQTVVKNDTITYLCSLPPNTTVGWDKFAGTPDAIQYSCYQQ
jgi:hypothetical protein